METLNTYKIGFGKYKGSTLIEIAEVNASYITWLKEKTNDQELIELLNLITVEVIPTWANVGSQRDVNTTTVLGGFDRNYEGSDKEGVVLYVNNSNLDLEAMEAERVAAIEAEREAEEAAQVRKEKGLAMEILRETGSIGKTTTQKLTFTITRRLRNGKVKAKFKGEFFITPMRKRIFEFDGEIEGLENPKEGETRKEELTFKTTSYSGFLYLVCNK